jgi:hypothetical protein
MEILFEVALKCVAEERDAIARGQQWAKCLKCFCTRKMILNLSNPL